MKVFETMKELRKYASENYVENGEVFTCKEEIKTPIMKLTYEKFIRLMNKYIRYGGRWHLTDCYFVFNDEGVCYCNTWKNAKEIKDKLDF
jgi:hypothetical protein